MLSNEQIERGLERCDGGQLACKAFGNEDKHVIYGAIRVVLEAMKFPEPEEEKKEDTFKFTDNSIPLPEGEKFMGFHKHEDRIFIFTDKSVQELVKDEPDPILEVWEKWKNKGIIRNMKEEYFIIPYAYVREIWKAIDQYAQSKKGVKE